MRAQCRRWSQGAAIWKFEAIGCYGRLSKMGNIRSNMSSFSASQSIKAVREWPRPVTSCPDMNVLFLFFFFFLETQVFNLLLNYHYFYFLTAATHESQTWLNPLPETQNTNTLHGHLFRLCWGNTPSISSLFGEEYLLRIQSNVFQFRKRLPLLVKLKFGTVS